jgi:hypothetical protein
MDIEQLLTDISQCDLRDIYRRDGKASHDSKRREVYVWEAERGGLEEGWTLFFVLIREDDTTTFRLMDTYRQVGELLGWPWAMEPVEEPALCR